MVNKEVKKATKKEDKPSKKEKFFYGVGRRKRAVAQVRIYSAKGVSENDAIVNEKKMKEYFPIFSLQDNILAPLKVVGLQSKFRISALVKGGGFNSQSEAIRLGVARALVEFDENLKSILKASSFLTRDSRKVERKKPGLKKARRAPQWAKR